MDKILLSTYIIKIRDNNRNDQILNRFNGTDDFLKVFEDYLNSIFQNIILTADANQATPLHLTLASPPIIDIPNRRIYGYLSSGFSGEEYQITDISSRENIFEVQKNHAAFRNLFFYIQIPLNQTAGALILQRKSKYGIKTVFQRTLNNYIKKRGYQMYKVLVNNLIHGRVYRKMMAEGNLKKVELVKRKIPASIEEYYNNNGNPNQIPGTLKTSILSPTSLPQAFKTFVNNLFTNPNHERIELEGIDEEFDEIEFELELNGKRKTFYVANRSRIQPDIDVTHQLDYIRGVPTTESLLLQAEELVQDIIDMRPENVS